MLKFSRKLFTFDEKGILNLSLGDLNLEVCRVRRSPSEDN